MYASKMADDMIKEKYPNSFNLTPSEVTECRRVLRQKITTEKKLMEKDKKASETVQDKTRKNNSDNKNQISNHKLKTDRVCKKWVNFKC